MTQQCKDIEEMLSHHIERELKKPFPIIKIKWRKGGGNKDLAYIDARDVMDRLDAIFGIAGWQVSYEFIGSRMMCSLTCRIGEEWITKCDGADDTQIESEKGGISSALKRSAVLWGIGRYLYHPKAFDKDKKPALWATPEGYDALLEERAKASVTKLHTTEKIDASKKEDKETKES